MYFYPGDEVDKGFVNRSFIKEAVLDDFSQEEKYNNIQILAFSAESRVKADLDIIQTIL